MLTLIIIIIIEKKLTKIFDIQQIYSECPNQVK